MKKFFGMLLAAVSALVLLPGCGGGGDADPTRVSVDEFKSGAKYFELRGGFAGHLIIKCDRIVDGYGKEGTDSTFGEGEGAVVYDSAESTTVDGKIGIGTANTQAGYTYTCFYDAEGVPQMAIINVSTVHNSSTEDDLIEFFQKAAAEDVEVDVRGGVNIVIDFNARSFVVEDMQIDPDPKQEDDERPLGGVVVVRRG